MSAATYEHVCLYHILDGLRQGLSGFSHPSRIAVIFAVRPDDPLRVSDPQNLLSGHEPRLAEYYLDNASWRKNQPRGSLTAYLPEEELRELQLAGLISYGGRSGSLFYQRWFTEHHLDLCCTGPTMRWMEYAVRLFSQNCEVKNVLGLDMAGIVLQDCGLHAVRDYMVDERSRLIGLDTGLRVYPILNIVLGISKTKEEGAWPRGRLAFVEPSSVPTMKFQLRFPEMERPGIENRKHVRKLLQAVEGHHTILVSDGREILGIADGRIPPASIIADFCGGHGFLRLDDDLICSFADGAFCASNRKANLVHLEEVLLESRLTPEKRHELFRIVSHLVKAAGERRHGCAIVVDLSASPMDIAGQKLVRPISLTRPELLRLAENLSKVDGALHLGADLRLHGFACLMDGNAVAGENRARGARFNSALRFSAAHPEVVVVVVSSDRPVSVIKDGLELTAQCEWVHMSGLAEPPSLEAWSGWKRPES